MRYLLKSRIIRNLHHMKIHIITNYISPSNLISPIYFLGSTELNHPANANKNSKLSSLQPVSSKSLRDEGWGSWNDKLGVPYFVANQTHLVLAPLDHTTYLHCIVGNLGDRQVHQRKKTDSYNE